MYNDINHYIESHSHNRVWADNLMVQASANTYSRNIEIVNEHRCTVNIDARQSTGRNLVITFNSKTQHYQSTEEASVHFNIGNRDVDTHVGSQDKDVDKQDDSDGECPQNFKDILKTVGDCGSDNTESDEDIDNSFKKELRSLHNNGGLRQILIDGKTDETKIPMLILKDCGQKGLAQLSYVNDAYPEYYRLHKRMSKKQNYFNYLHLFVQKNYKDLLNMFERCYIDILVYAIIILCGKSSLIEPKIISTPSYIHTSL